MEKKGRKGGKSRRLFIPEFGQVDQGGLAKVKGDLRTKINE